MASDTRIWGPWIWDVLHFAVMPFHDQPMLVDDVDRFMAILTALLFVLPCNKCIESYVEFFNQMGFRHACIQGQAALAMWKLHLAVSDKLDMQKEAEGVLPPPRMPWTFEQVRERYDWNRSENVERVAESMAKLWHLLGERYPLHASTDDSHFLHSMHTMIFMYTLPTFMPFDAFKRFYLPFHDEMLLRTIFQSQDKVRNWVAFAIDTD